MATVFVTGGSSALGSWIIERLAPQHRVIAALHRKPIQTGAAITTVTDGLSRCEDHAPVIQSADVVLHMAAITRTNDERQYHEVNFELTRRLLAVCRPNQFFVYVSTQCAHPDAGGYGKSKWLAENVVRESGMQFALIRPTDIYGSNMNEGIDALLGLATRRRVIPDFRWNGSITYAPVSAGEVGGFVVRVVTGPRPESEMYTLCNDERCTARDIATALEEEFGRVTVVPCPLQVLKALTALRLPLPFKRDQVDRLIAPKQLDNTLAKQDYNFAPTSFTAYLKSLRAR